MLLCYLQDWAQPIAIRADSQVRVAHLLLLYLSYMNLFLHLNIHHLLHYLDLYPQKQILSVPIYYLLKLFCLVPSYHLHLLTILLHNLYLKHLLMVNLNLPLLLLLHLFLIILLLNLLLHNRVLLLLFVLLIL